MRGFHDILITVGIVVLLLGLGTLVNFLGVLPAIIVLAEWFVRRQRLALPAFTLTIMLAVIVELFAPQINEPGSIMELATRFGWQFARSGCFIGATACGEPLRLCWLYFSLLAILWSST